MHYLLLSILSSLIILVIFKVLGRRKTDIFYPIVINYIIAAAIGFVMEGNSERFSALPSQPWIIHGMVIGVLLIVTFYLIGSSTQKAGMTVTSIAGRMSMIAPIVYSLVFYDNDLHFLKISGILLALAAVFLSVYKKKDRVSDSGSLTYLMPFLVFAGMGLIDTLINYCEKEFKPDYAFFTSVLFAISGILGLMIGLVRRIKLKGFIEKNALVGGILLGIANYSSIFFILKFLGENYFERSIVFGINNIGIVLLSVLIGLGFFKEKLNPLNWIGVGLSIAAISVLMLYEKLV